MFSKFEECSLELFNGWDAQCLKMSLQLQEFRVTMTQCRLNGRHNFLSNLAVDYLAFLELLTEAGYLEESRDFFFLIQGLLACKVCSQIDSRNALSFCQLDDQGRERRD